MELCCYNKCWLSLPVVHAKPHASLHQAFPTVRVSCSNILKDGVYRQLCQHPVNAERAQRLDLHHNSKVSTTFLLLRSISSTA